MKATNGLHVPKKDGDAGYDLLSADWVELEPGGYVVIHTSAACEIPEGYCGIIIGRSGNNTKGIICCVGLVDSGYRGFIKVLLQNLNKHVSVNFKPGDRVAQMVLVPYGNFPLEVVDFERLTPSERGDTGFGSTGR